MSIFCNQCGVANIDQASFCKECGNSLDEQRRKAREAEERAREEQERIDREEAERKKRKAEELAKEDTTEEKEATRASYEASTDNKQTEKSSSDVLKFLILIASIIGLIYWANQIFNPAKLFNGTEHQNLTESAVEQNVTELNAAPAVETTQSEAYDLLNKADKLWNQKNGNFSDTKLALEYLNRSIELYPTANAYNMRALAYEDIGKHKKAIADYTEAIKLSPNDKVLHSNRGWTYYRADNIEKAKVDAKKACELGDCQLLEQLKSDIPSNKAFEVCSFWLEDPARYDEYDKCLKNVDFK